MKSIDLLKELEKYPIFTINDLSKLLGKSPEYVAVRVKRLLEQGRIRRIERGKYTLHEDPLIFASHIRYPSYIALWSALRFHDLTTQLPNAVFVCSPTSKKRIDFYGTDIVFVKNANPWGYKKYMHDGFEVFVSDKEKTLIDGLLTGMVPLHEVENAIREVDGKKMVEYAKRTENTSLIKRVGYLLDASGRDYKCLEKWAKYPYTVLDTHFKKDGPKNPKWKLIVNRQND